MTREEYERLYDTKQDIIDITDADVIEWLDNIVEALKRLNRCRYDLYYGKLDKEKEEYEKRIELCSFEPLRLHVYEGIDTLAKIVGCEITLFDISDGNSDYDYDYEYYFKYKGVYVFQLGKKPLEE